MTKNKKERIQMQTNEQVEKSKALVSGVWTDGTPWQFHVDQSFPDHSLCTASFGVVIDRKKVIVVEHATRGWELPGGHIEPGEDPQQALVREVLEETGVVGQVDTYFGFKKISPNKPVPKRGSEGHYPFPHSFVPYSIVSVSEMLAIGLAPDVKQVQLVSVDQAIRLFAKSVSDFGVDHGHGSIVSYCLEKGLI